MTATAADARDKLFAEIAVREGIATDAQVDECLAIRAKLVKAGAQTKTLPEILLAKGFITKDAAKRLVASAEAAEAGMPEPIIVERPRPKDPGAESLPEIPGFEVLGLLGKGGMGAVFKARQLSLDRVVALKVLSPEAARDETFIRRFTNEARTLARLNHENIIAGIDVGEAKGSRYFAMEYVEGEPLSSTIEREGALAEKRVLRIGMQIARALAHAEKNGLVHRDVKPQNIMLGKNDVAKLCDLGLAMTPEEQKDAAERGQSIGTPHYISPEQARGEHKVDIRSDIYSLGAALYHASCGETPFTGSSPMVLMTKHLTEEPPPPKKRRPSIGKGLNDLIVKMMAKEKEKRFQSPLDLLEEMERVLSGKAAPAAAPAPAEPGQRAPGAAAAGAAPRAAKPPPARRGAPRAATPAPEGSDGQQPERPRYRRKARGNGPLIFAGLAVLLCLGAVAAIKKTYEERNAQDSIVAPPSQDFEEAARQSLVNVRTDYLKNKDKYVAMGALRTIIARFPGTAGARAAADDLKTIEAAPFQKSGDAPEPEAPPPAGPG